MALTNYVLMPGADYQAACDAIRAKTGKTNALKSGELASEISAIMGGGGASGDERVKYVTFMHNGMELIKYPVISGDTCHDPVSKSLIGTPTKESTAQYEYTHNGWSLTEGGSASTSALANVTEDRVVYAAFSSTVRKYTITYYDSDGVTVLKTESLAYGEMPSYAPTKGDYVLDAWIPAVASVTGDMSYSATWKAKPAFETLSWEEIAAISERGEAEQYFKVGDTKDIVLTRYDLGEGVTETIQVAIAGFNHDTLEDGTTKAGMSIVSMTVPDRKLRWSMWAQHSQYGNSMGQYYGRPSTATGNYGSSSDVRTSLNNKGNYSLYGWLPAELKAVIKPVLKSYDISYQAGTSTETQTTAENVWALSLTELGDNGANIGTNVITQLGSRYELFEYGNLTSNILPRIKLSSGGACGSYWTRSIHRNNASVSPIYIDQASTSRVSYYYGYSQTNIETQRYLRFGFCI